jgi:hypothetical protein
LPDSVGAQWRWIWRMLAFVELRTEAQGKLAETRPRRSARPALGPQRPPVRKGQRRYANAQLDIPFLPVNTRQATVQKARYGTRGSARPPLLTT